MAITPISQDMNQNRASIVNQMLDRGGRSLSQMLGAAIQLGRNAVDNQARQEGAFLAEQRRELNYNERRADALAASQQAQEKAAEERRRFNLGFNQAERFEQNKLMESAQDRAIRSLQVEGGLALGQAQLGMQREQMQEGRAARLFSQGVAGQEEARRQEEFKLSRRKTEAEIGQLESGNENQQAFLQEFSRATPSQKTDLLNRQGFSLGFDATTTKALIEQSDIGVTQEQKALIDRLPAPERASAEGLTKAIEELEVKLRMGRKGPLGEFISLTPAERDAVEVDLRDAKSRLGQTLGSVGGSAPAAAGRDSVGDFLNRIPSKSQQ